MNAPLRNSDSRSVERRIKRRSVEPVRGGGEEELAGRGDPRNPAMPGAPVNSSGPSLVLHEGKISNRKTAATEPTEPVGIPPHIEELLVHEAEVREQASAIALKYLIANNSRTLLSASQVVFLAPRFRKNRFAIDTISSVAQLDKNAPAVRWLETEINGLLPNRVEDQISVSVNRLSSENAPGGLYPFPHAVFIRMRNRSGQDIGLLVGLSPKPFGEPALAMANRLGSTYAHALAGFGKPKSRWPWLFERKSLAGGSLLALALMFMPVSMTVLAPVEVQPKDALVVAAPLQGVVETIHVSPNTPVKKGELLFSYVKTDLQSRSDLAERNLSVVTARLNRASQEAFGRGAGRRDLAVTKAEQQMAIAERNFARENLARTEVRANRDGVVLFKSVDEWTGKPVATGERVMRIADPASVQFKISLSVSDAIILDDEARALIYLDSAPLNPVEATIVRKSYQAEKTDTDMLAYELLGEVGNDPDAPPLRIGLKGTAQLFGDKVSLGFFLFRKPIAAIRQFVGI